MAFAAPGWKAANSPCAGADVDGTDRLVLVGRAAADAQFVHAAEVPEHRALLVPRTSKP